MPARGVPAGADRAGGCDERDGQLHRVPGGHLSDSLAERLALLFEAALALPENGGRRGALVLAGGATVGMGWGLPRLTGIHVVVQVAP